MKKNNQPTIIIIVGISGDLSRRKLLPALSQIVSAGAMPDKYKIIGITRQSNLVVADLFLKTKDPDIIKNWRNI
jgi:glucose-6-phosphate 1-dehydrogenase